MPETRPTRSQGDLADVLELVLDKGVVVNADVVVSVGDTELLSVELRAAIASFETAAEYGLRFPSGTDTDRVAAAAGVAPIRDRPADQTTLGDLDELAAGEKAAGAGDEHGETEPREVPEADDQD